LLEEARGEAEKIVTEARTEADTFARERDAKKAEVEAEMAQMTDLVAGVRTKLAVLATTVADKLDEMDAVVAGARGTGQEDADTGTGTAETGGDGESAGDGEYEGGDEGVEEAAEGESADEPTGGEEESGLEVDIDEGSAEQADEDAGSAEIEGVDVAEENQEI
jgi:hypothetical protein